MGVLRIIRLGRLLDVRHPSSQLQKCLQGLEAPLAGLVIKPFDPTKTVEEDFVNHQHDDRYCIVVDKIHVIQALEKKDFHKAANEVKSKYADWLRLPFVRRSCELQPL